MALVRDKEHFKCSLTLSIDASQRAPVGENTHWSLFVFFLRCVIGNVAC